MSIKFNPYLGFNGNARAAVEFYQSIFGGETSFTTFGEGMPGGDAADKDKIMHATLDAGAISFMAADSQRSDGFNDSLSLSLSGDDHDQLTGYFNALAAGGKVTMPLADQGWGDLFGMLVDQFGLTWMVNITKPQA